MKGLEPPPTPTREDCSCVLTTSMGQVMVEATAPAKPCVGREGVTVVAQVR